MLKLGSRWKSQVCTAEAVLVRAPQSAGAPQCGGEDMLPSGSTGETSAPRPGFDTGCQIGKRYKSEAEGIEMLCVKAGQGTLGFNGIALTLVPSKQLPASD
jgi:hypothetical protein